MRWTPSSRKDREIECASARARRRLTRCAAAIENNETRALLAIRAVGVSMSIDDASSCADRGVANGTT
jgi:hypothetical protein